jgi:citrate synthase
MGKDSLSITDNRTGKSYEIAIEHGTIKSMELRGIKENEDDFGLMSYDPAYKNTASTKSTITYIDGEKGILRYRGYPIDQLAQANNFIEVAYLLLFGSLPSAEEYQDWEREITHHTFLHENLKSLMQAFRYDAHPMGMFISSVSALSTFYPEARNVDDPDSRLYQIKRLIAKVPTIAAFSYRHTRGLPYVYPDNDLSYTGNFLNMMFKMSEAKYEPDPVLAHGSLRMPWMCSSSCTQIMNRTAARARCAISVQRKLIRTALSPVRQQPFTDRCMGAQMRLSCAC